MYRTEDVLGFIGLAVVVSVFIAGCVLFITILSSAGFGDEYKELSSYEQFEIEIGEQREIEFVKHIEGNEYELGFTNNNGELVWETMFADDELTVKYDDSTDKTILSKQKNSTWWFTIRNVNYTLIVGKGNIQGGEIERNCGKNCTEEIQTEVIN